MLFGINRREREDLLRQIMEKYEKPLYWHIRRLVVTHEDTQDILQEVFIKVYSHIGTLREQDKLKAWLYRIATNISLRHIEQEKRRMANSLDAEEILVGKLEAASFVDYDKEMELKFQKALLHLTPDQRTVFNLRYYDEMPYEEIAQITGAKIDTLKVRYHLAKEKIQDYIKSH